MPDLYQLASPGRRRRPASRLLVVSPAGRVLLFHFSHSSGPLAGQSYWATPGGGVEPGETFEAAAIRELLEEVGPQSYTLGPEVARREFVMQLPSGEQVVADERYFVVRINESAPSRERWSAEEAQVMTTHRWWSTQELENTSERIFPEGLHSMLAAVQVLTQSWVRQNSVIRHYQQSDWPAVWPLLRTTFATGDTYAFSPESTEAEIHKAWVEAPAATYVACAPDGSLLGTYILKANQPGLGAHVCNCGYVVAPEAQGQGIASAMCAHSQREAVAMGFLAMQFNLVVSTNEHAVRLWQKLGFAIVGTLPRAFRHQRLGFVDAYVMYKELAA